MFEESPQTDDRDNTAAAPSPRTTKAAADRLGCPAPDTGDDGERPLADVTRELCELASQLAADTCRWLTLLAEFDRREGWAGFGIRSCAQWLSWRCALSLSTAYEQLRVAHALADLPAVRAEFAAGRLSYSKVRAISRMADGDTEESVLLTAQSCTAAQLDRLARAYRRAVRPEEDMQRAGHRHFCWHWDDEGYLVVEGRLPPEQGATLLAALRAASDHIEADSPEPGRAEPENTAPDDTQAHATADDGADVGGAKSDPNGPQQPAAEAASPDYSAEESPVAGSATIQPEPRGGPTSLTPQRSAAELRSPTDDPGVLMRAHAHAREARAADALVLLAETTLAHQPTFVRGGDRYRVMLHVDLAALAGSDQPGSEAAAGEPIRPATAVTPRSGGVSNKRMHIDDGPALSVTAAQRITCHASVVALLRGPRGQLLDVGRSTRTIPPAVTRALHIRDRGCCRFPGCQRRTGLEAHHIIHWAHGGPTRLDNLVLLCRLHHWLIHEGGFTVEAPVIEHATFRRPDGELLAEVPTLTAAELPAAAYGRTLRGSADSLTPPWWYGEPLRLAYVVSAILDDRDRRSSDPHRHQLVATAEYNAASRASTNAA